MVVYATLMTGDQSRETVGRPNRPGRRRADWADQLVERLMELGAVAEHE